MESHETKGKNEDRIKEETKHRDRNKKMLEKKTLHKHGKIRHSNASLVFNSPATSHGSFLLDNSQTSFTSGTEKISDFQGSTQKFDTLTHKDPESSNYYVYMDNSTGSPLLQQVVPGAIMQSSEELPQIQTTSEIPTGLSYFCGNILETDKIRPSMALTEQPMAIVFDPNLPKQGQQQIYLDSSSLLDLNQSVIINANESVAVGKESNQNIGEVLVTTHPIEEETPGDKNVQAILMATEDENYSQSASEVNLLSVASVQWENESKMLAEHSANNHMREDLKEVEEMKAQQRQIDQRHLEQSHLAHQTNLIQQRSRSKKDVLIRKSSLEEHLKSLGIDDSIPIFTSVSAKLNPLIISQVPGCQQFLLNDSSASSKVSNIITDSTSEWSFQGNMAELTSLHNTIKSLMHLKSQTNLRFQIIGNDKDMKEDKGIYCNILAPYISSKGRISKQSMKAKQAEAMLRLDEDLMNYVEDSNFMEDSKSPKKTWRKRKMHHVRKKRKNLNTLTATANASIKSPKDSQYAPPADLVADADKGQGEPSEADNKLSAEPDLSDPLQERLRQEQIKYRQILDNENKIRQLKSILLESSERASSEQNDQDTADEKNTNTSNDVTPPKKKKGRPPKEYDPNEDMEKVSPRNPLTESDSTKQQRVYEEHVSFKFFCQQCSFKTKRKSQFDTHLQCHEKYPNTRYSCGVCDYISLSLPALRRHELKHKKNLLRCEICTVYKTDKKYLMQRHIRIKHSNFESQPKYSCDQCSAEFSSSYKLTRHQAKHAKSSLEKAIKYACTQCKKDFRQRIHLRRHIRDVHGPELRPHLCDKCGKSFKRTDALQQHKIIHSAPCARKFPFKCVDCNKTFRSQAHLKEHMSVHSTERPFLCHYCGAAFKTQPVQKKHILTLHIRPRTHVCGVCCRQFNTKNALLKHENIHKPPEETLGDEHEKHEEYITQQTEELGVSVVAKGNNSTCLRHQVTSALVIDISTGTGVVLDQDNNMTSNIIEHTDITGATNPPGVIARPPVQASVAQQQDCIHDSQTGQSFYYLTH